MFVISIMSPTRMVYIVSLVLSIISVIVGIPKERADLFMPGAISTLLMVIIIHQSFNGKNLKVWVVFILDLMLTIGLLNVLMTPFTEYLQFILATPLFVAVGGVLLCCLIAYCDLRLDRAMMSVYYIFLTLFISNIFSYGVLILVTLNGVPDHEVANFWLGTEFGVAFIICVASLIGLRRNLKRRNIRLITSKDLLEAL